MTSHGSATLIDGCNSSSTMHRISFGHGRALIKSPQRITEASQHHMLFRQKEVPVAGISGMIWVGLDTVGVPYDPCALTNMAYGNAHAHKPEALLFGPTKIFLNLDWETNGRGQ